jgi:hypothetical protein
MRAAWIEAGVANEYEVRTCLADSVEEFTEALAA